MQQPELPGKGLTSDVWAFAGSDAYAGDDGDRHRLTRHREAGHVDAARGYYRRYLAATATLDNPEVRRLRDLAARRSAALGQP